MTHLEFITLVTKMRTTQKRYFRLRQTNTPVDLRNEVLRESKAIEKQVDDEIEILNGSKIDI